MALSIQNCWQISVGMGLQNEGRLNIPSVVEGMERTKASTNSYSMSNPPDCMGSTAQICSSNNPPTITSSTIPPLRSSPISRFSFGEHFMNSGNPLLLNTTSVPLHTFRQFQPNYMGLNPIESRRLDQQQPLAYSNWPMSTDGNQDLHKTFGAEVITPDQFFTGGSNGVGQYHSIGVDHRPFASDYTTANGIHTILTPTSAPPTTEPARRRSKDSKSHPNRSISVESNRTPLPHTVSTPNAVVCQRCNRISVHTNGRDFRTQICSCLISESHSESVPLNFCSHGQPPTEMSGRKSSLFHIGYEEYRQGVSTIPSQPLSFSQDQAEFEGNMAQQNHFQSQQGLLNPSTDDSMNWPSESGTPADESPAAYPSRPVGWESNLPGPAKMEWTPQNYSESDGVDMMLNYWDSASTTPTTSKKQQPPVNNGSLIQLWQFILNELNDPSARNHIAWTGVEGEFKLKNPSEVARRWGLKKNKPKMNYEKLSRGLRYYYDKNILRKVAGKRYVYCFTSNIMRRLACRIEQPIYTDTSSTESIVEVQL
ncbi:hypothetical protein Aperf_G00000073990 [Anoplocephala perfoliata]